MLERIKRYLQNNHLPQLAAVLCAVLMLACLPLVFRNALFDINRVKAELLIAAVPICVLLSGAGFSASRKYLILFREVKMAFLCIFLFAVSAVISAGRSGFSHAVLYGIQGRQCGLLFLLACSAGVLVIAAGGLQGTNIRLMASVSAAMVALLGVLNAVGIDPFGFYVRMQKGQEHLFLSTIGNIDFFGCYLALMLPLAAAGWIFPDNRMRGWLCFACSVSIICGIAVSRSDTALIAVQVGMLVLLIYSGNSYVSMAKTLFLWGLSFFALPLMYDVLKNTEYFMPVNGLFLLFCESPAAWVGGIVLLAGCVCCRCASKNGKKLPGVRRIAVLAMTAVFILLLLLIAAIVCFTVVFPEAEIGVLSSFLRFNDHWGTRRGFVYRCSMNALAGFSPLDWFFGRGVDMTRHILEPYFDNPSMLAHGVFNDAHCQPLQYLLTIGLLGAGSLTAFYLSAMICFARHAKIDMSLCGCFAALSAYIPVALLSVSQPILIASFFAVCAAGLSRVQYLSVREGTL